MGKQPVHIGGKGATDRAVCSPPRGKTCCLEIAKMKRMGYNVFAFKQTSDEGESRRVRYIYASDKETITCRKKLLRRPREERTHADLSAMLDDETVVGAELVKDPEVTTAVGSDDAMSETTETFSNDSGARDDVFVPVVLSDDECDFMSFPELDDIPDDCVVAFEERGSRVKEEEQAFFDALRDWVYDEGVSA